MSNDVEHYITNIQKAYDRQVDELLRYRAAINAIDDYFEYRCISEQDQKYVHQVLNNLTRHLKDDEHKRLTSSG